MLYRRSRYRQNLKCGNFALFLRRVKRNVQTTRRACSWLFSRSITVDILWSYRHFVGASFCLGCHLYLIKVSWYASSSLRAKISENSEHTFSDPGRFHWSLSNVCIFLPECYCSVLSNVQFVVLEVLDIKKKTNHDNGSLVSVNVLQVARSRSSLLFYYCGNPKLRQERNRTPCN